MKQSDTENQQTLNNKTNIAVKPSGKLNPGGQFDKNAKAITKGFKDNQSEFMVTLKKDHGFDIIANIVHEIQVIKNTKKMKLIEKRRLLKDYYLTLLSYCVPKTQISKGDGKPAGLYQFNISIGEDKPKRGPGRPRKNVPGQVNIVIPTKKTKSGNFSVDTSRIID